MNQAKPYLFVLIIAFAFSSCKKPLDVKSTGIDGNILVVEGLINAGADSTKINLSRTVITGNKKTANPETKAVITIENAQATVATLTEIAKGKYAVPGLNLDVTKQYRLRIKTANGKTYASDLVDTKITPPIDSVGFKVNADGIQVYANTHDDTNNSRYYLYTYSDTWKFETKLMSLYYTTGKEILQRSPSQFLNLCYTNGSSTIVLLASTAALSKDVSYQFPLTTIPSTSERISIRYSILVSQMVITKQAYAFWDNLRRNTEQLGSIFDAQPSQLIGNIHNVNDPSEPVIGYISASTIQTKRIFIDRKQLPAAWKVQYPFGCSIDTAKLAKPQGLQSEVEMYLLPLSSGNMILGPYGLTSTLGFTYTSPACADCTIRGVLKAPDFWK